MEVLAHIGEQYSLGAGRIGRARHLGQLRERQADGQAAGAAAQKKDHLRH